MSVFTPVTFPFQPFTPEANAIIQRGIYEDGLLTDIEFTFSGADLVASPGYFIMAGRQFRLPNATPFTSTSQTADGFGRLKFVIDTSKESTVENFDQIEPVWEYSTSLVFPDLQQDDINILTTGIYEQEIATVSFSGYQIGAIINTIKKTEGGGLNYKVIAVASEDDIPTNANEKTVVVITETPTINHAWGSDEPMPTGEGFVWFYTYYSSPAAMTLDKKGLVKVFPVAALQWNGTNWVYRKSMTMLNGLWTGWWEPKYAFGDESFLAWSQGFVSAGGNITKETASIRLNVPDGGYATVRSNSLNPALYKRLISLVSFDALLSRDPYFITSISTDPAANPFNDNSFKTLRYNGYANGGKVGNKWTIEFTTYTASDTRYARLAAVLGGTARMHAVFAEPL